MDKIVKILEEIELPFAYDHFAEGESREARCICYLTPTRECFPADGAVSHRIYDVHIEVYTNKKDTDIETKVEAVLDKHKIFYNKSEIWIDSEKLYETIYSFGTEVD